MAYTDPEISRWRLKSKTRPPLIYNNEPLMKMRKEYGVPRVDINLAFIEMLGCVNKNLDLIAYNAPLSTQTICFTVSTDGSYVLRSCTDDQEVVRVAQLLTKKNRYWKTSIAAPSDDLQKLSELLLLEIPNEGLEQEEDGRPRLLHYEHIKAGEEIEGPIPKLQLVGSSKYASKMGLTDESFVGVKVDQLLMRELLPKVTLPESIFCSMLPERLELFIQTKSVEIYQKWDDRLKIWFSYIAGKKDPINILVTNKNVRFTT